MTTVKERLAAKATTKTSGSKKKDKIVLALPKDLIQEADRLSAALHAKDSIIAHEKAARTVLMPALQRLVYGGWIQEGRKLDSPIVNTPCGNHFSVQCRDSISGPRGFKLQGDNRKSVAEHLRDNNVPESIIEATKDDFVEKLTVAVNIPKLEDSYPQLAEKLMEVILAACEKGVKVGDKLIKFNDEESSKILEQVNEVKVKEGFLERSITYAKQIAPNPETAVETLFSLLRAVPPTWAISQNHCENPTVSIANLLKTPVTEEKEDAKPVDMETTDKKFVLRVQGSTVTVFKRKGASLDEICKKSCKDNSHATNTAKKFIREPEALQAFIADSL